MNSYIEKVLKEVDEMFTLDWAKGFGTKEDIDKLGLAGIKSFIQSSLENQLKEIVEMIKNDGSYCENHEYCEGNCCNSHCCDMREKEIINLLTKDIKE